ncbi:MULTISPECIES: PilZ domain-containing protein [unclassified Thalassotalea]|uniref:PilZ domain-containing protein n=1 Tax=unclassified Thalassotalea TaxID=2614972 RepID=UPI0010815554|nr:MULTISPECIES: PilZ domain-containing protein [unclassified Thalassotalea]NMP16455.1 PilZ domain-containing protein [Thalassotalea sp. Y01]QBY03175.1 PilZ domain-containing protein [Thalassotalea sp. HSM 43]
MSETNIEPIERRQFFRIDMEGELVNVTWRDADGQAHKVKCICADFSKGGLRIEYDYPIAVGTVVDFKFQEDHPESRTLQAKVIRCIETKDAIYSIGFQMT